MGAAPLRQTCSLAELPDVWQTWQATGATALVVLLGQPVAHSVSPAMHGAAFRAAGLPYAYIACDVSPDDFPEALQSLADLGAIGCNVTIPHKERALQVSVVQSHTSIAAGAANCLTRHGADWHAANTDVGGLVTALTVDHGCELTGRPGVVIGTGGFARAAVVALQQAGCSSVTVLGRRPEAAQALVKSVGGSPSSRVHAAPLTDHAADEALAHAAVCVNATPVGMWPNTGESPLDVARLGDGCFVYDSIYNPAETLFVKDARARGLRAATGLSLLVRQGAESWRHWFGQAAPDTVMWEAAAGAI